MLEQRTFEPWLTAWGLVPDGAPFETHSSRLMPVRAEGRAAMLKLPMEAEEKRGSAIMAWWAGQGAAEVLACDADALLLERAEGPRSLRAMVDAGDDDGATRILCDTVMRLHARLGAPPEAVTLTRWFAALAPGAARYGGVVARSHAEAERLLADQQEVCVLHGDLHHDNVLDFGARGWLAIDPKGLIGDRGFDFANILCNPEDETPLRPGRLVRQAGVIADASGMARERILRWTLAYAGLSVVWFMDDALDGSAPLRIAELAAEALG